MADNITWIKVTLSSGRVIEIDENDFLHMLNHHDVSHAEHRSDLRRTMLRQPDINLQLTDYDTMLLEQMKIRV